VSRRRRLLVILLFAAPLAGAAFLALLLSREAPLPAGLAGELVFVREQAGLDTLFARRLPGGPDRLLVATSESVREPALSPDGGSVAFSLGGRLAIVSVATGDLRVVTLGVDFQDSSPCWRPDGRALVVSARRRGELYAGLHQIALFATDGQPARQILTQARGLDDSSPVFTPDGSALIFVRQQGLFRLTLADGRAVRLTSGFRLYRAPCFLPSGRLLALWSQEKRYGMDLMDADGKNRETLQEGSTFYRSVAPSPDGHFLAATFVFDLHFHLADAVRLRRAERIDLLDARGQPWGRLVASWRRRSHSPQWGR
jgi:Tol biopolymer transport system component